MSLKRGVVLQALVGALLVTINVKDLQAQANTGQVESDAPAASQTGSVVNSGTGAKQVTLKMQPTAVSQDIAKQTGTQVNTKVVDEQLNTAQASDTESGAEAQAKSQSTAQLVKPTQPKATTQTQALLATDTEAPNMENSQPVTTPKQPTVPTNLTSQTENKEVVSATNVAAKPARLVKHLPDSMVTRSESSKQSTNSVSQVDISTNSQSPESVQGTLNEVQNTPQKVQPVTLNTTEPVVWDSGVSGTAPWDINHNVLTIHRGTGEKAGQLAYATWRQSKYVNVIKRVVVDSGVKAPRSISGLFSRLPYAEEMNLKGLDTSGVTSMQGWFEEDYSLKSLDLRSWDTSNVTEMQWMFDLARDEGHLTSLQLSGWNVKKLRNTQGMFSKQSQLSHLDFTGWETPSLTTMDRMFWMSGLVDLDVSRFDTSHVTNMSYVFAYMSQLQHLDLTGWQTKQVTNMEKMFERDNGMLTLNLGEFDMTNVTNGAGTFDQLDRLKRVTLGPNIFLGPQVGQMSVTQFGNHYNSPAVDTSWQDVRTGEKFTSEQVANLYGPNNVHQKRTFDAIPPIVTVTLTGPQISLGTNPNLVIDPAKYAVDIENSTKYSDHYNAPEFRYTLTASDLTLAAVPGVVGVYNVQLTTAAKQRIEALPASQQDPLEHTWIYQEQLAAPVATIRLSGHQQATYTGNVITPAPQDYVVSLDNGLQYQLQADDLKVVTGAAVNAGQYAVTLSEAGMAHIQALGVNHFQWQFDDAVLGSLVIAPKLIKLTLQRRAGIQHVYNGQPWVADPQDYQLTGQLVDGQFENPLVATDLTLPAEQVVNAGQYVVTLSMAGQVRAQTKLGTNYVGDFTGATSGLVIEQAPAKIQLQPSVIGGVQVNYTGTKISIPVKDYQVTLIGTVSQQRSLGGLTYQLQDGDLSFVNDQPTNVGTYQVQLTATGLARIQALDARNYQWQVDPDAAVATLTVIPTLRLVDLQGSGQTMYDGQVASLNVTDYQLVANDGQQYALQAGDLAFTTVTPVSAGQYTVGLTDAGRTRLTQLYPNYHWVFGQVTASYQITPAPGHVVLTGHRSQDYTGHPAELPTTGYTLRYSNGQTVQLSVGDLAWTGQLPQHAGDYSVQLSEQGRQKMLALGSQNYTWQEAVGEADYQILPVIAMVKLVGRQANTYTGQAFTPDTHQYQIQLSNGLTYQLQSGDLIVNAGEPTVTVGNYQVELTAPAVQRIQALNARDYVWRLIPGHATLVITPMEVELNLVGKQTVTYCAQPVMLDARDYQVVTTDQHYYQLQTSDLAFLAVNQPQSVGTYQVRLTSAGAARILALAPYNQHWHLETTTAPYMIVPRLTTVQLTGHAQQTYVAGSQAIPASAFTVILTNGYHYQLKPGDLTSSTSNLENVGQYQIVLTTQGKKHIEALSTNEIWRYQASTAQLTIQPAVVAVQLVGHDTAIYNGQPQAPKLNRYRVELPSGMQYHLQAGDLAFTGGPAVISGDYQLMWTKLGRERLAEISGGRYQWQLVTNQARFTIERMPVSIHLSGTSRGSGYEFPVQLDVGGYHVTLSNGWHYALQPDDLTLVVPENVATGQYAVQLTVQGLTAIQALDLHNIIWTNDGSRGMYEFTQLVDPVVPPKNPEPMIPSEDQKSVVPPKKSTSSSTLTGSQPDATVQLPFKDRTKQGQAEVTGVIVKNQRVDPHNKLEDVNQVETDIETRGAQTQIMPKTKQADAQSLDKVSLKRLPQTAEQAPKRLQLLGIIILGWLSSLTLWRRRH